MVTKDFVNQTCKNTKCDYIEITEDKLENILIKFLIDFKNADVWVTPLSISLTILIAILTASEFKNFLGISKDIWSAIFYVSLVICFIWLLISSIRSCKNRKKIKIEYLIKTIKNDSNNN